VEVGKLTKKIIFIIRDLGAKGGGAERVLSIISNSLAKDYSIHIVQLYNNSNELFYKFDKDIRISTIGVKYSPAKLTKVINLFRQIIYIGKILRQYRPDYAIGFMHSSFIPLALSYPIHLNKNIFGSEHINFENYKKKYLERFLYIVSIFFLKKITITTDKVKDKFPYVYRRKMITINNPFFCHLGLQKMKDFDKKNAFEILSVGRFFEQKNHITLIKAFHFLKEDFPNIRLKIIGGGPLKEEYRKTIRENKVTDIEIIDFTDKISRYFLLADIFVMPSIYESHGMVTNEALCLGKPVVAFKSCPGTSELIKHGFNGFLADGNFDNFKSLALEISRLLSSPDLYKKISQNAYESSKSKQNNDSIIQSWKDLLS